MYSVYGECVNRFRFVPLCRIGFSSKLRKAHQGRVGHNAFQHKRLRMILCPTPISTLKFASQIPCHRHIPINAHIRLRLVSVLNSRHSAGWPDLQSKPCTRHDSQISKRTRRSRFRLSSPDPLNGISSPVDCRLSSLADGCGSLGHGVLCAGDPINDAPFHPASIRVGIPSGDETEMTAVIGDVQCDIRRWR